MLIPMQINGNYSYEVKNHFGSNYAMVGDARGFIDPIFSSGVFLSIKSASLVVAAIDKQLRGEVKPGDDAMAHAYRMISGAYNFVHRMIKLFYNPHTVTWAQAGADGQAHKNHESAMAAGITCSRAISSRTTRSSRGSSKSWSTRRTSGVTRSW